MARPWAPLHAPAFRIPRGCRQQLGHPCHRTMRSCWGRQRDRCQLDYPFRADTTQQDQHHSDVCRRGIAVHWSSIHIRIASAALFHREFECTMNLLVRFEIKTGSWFLFDGVCQECDWVSMAAPTKHWVQYENGQPFGRFCR